MNRVMSKPSIPKGTRDFLPSEMLRRNYIFDTIKEQFRLFGYEQIETPSQELMSTLMGKYGEEGDRLVFRILDSGNWLSKLSDEDILERNVAHLTTKVAEKGLRYDLTVPFARFVVQHKSEISLPFKRYQIQPVWRADRPQKGRYREFYQCDADVVGTDSLLMEVEFVELAKAIFSKLQLKVVMLLNNRKILAGIAESIGIPERLTEMTVAMDKFDKVGLEGVIEELKKCEFKEGCITALKPFLLLEGDNEAQLSQLEVLLKASSIGLEGIQEMRFILSHLPQEVEEAFEVRFDSRLARGLGYYTGTIMEIKSHEVEIGSISGGGRYDNLTGIFGEKGLSGVGISFGAERIYDVLEKLDRFPKELEGSCQVLFANLGEEETQYLLPLLRNLREKGISCMVYPDCAKLKKQLSFADNRKIPYVVIAGSSEMSEGKVTLKNMTTGVQEALAKERLVEQWMK
ncbi:histidine--tRNA ligase [Porphyromonas miyakawae]